MMRNRFTKILVMSVAFTAISWTLAFVFAAMAGETTESTVAKLKDRLNQGESVQESEDIDFTGIERVVIHGGTRDVGVVPVVSAQGRAEFSGTVTPGGKVLQIERKDNVLIIQLDRDRAKGLVWNFGDDDNAGIKVTFEGLRISLPANLIKDVEIYATTGDIEVNDVQVGTLSIVATTGDVEMVNCKAEGSVKTTTGDIEVQNFSGKLSLKSTSGEIEATKVTGEELEIGATAGDVEVREVDTMALRAKVTSGDISVRLSDGLGWKFNLSATSGDIDNQWSDDANGKKLMTLKTTSGDIRVHR